MAETEINSERRKKRLVQLLNQSNAANIPHDGELEQLIEEFFIDEPESTSDDEEEDSMICGGGDVLELPMEEEEDTPLVHVVTVTGEGERSTNNDAQAECNYPNAITAAGFACNCKQIKFAGEENLPPGQRRGCIAQFSADEIVDLQLNVLEMTRDEVDMLIMGVFSSNMRQGPTTECTRKKAQKDRERTRVVYTLLGRLVCKVTFCFLLGIGDKRLRNVMSHFKDSKGPCPRVDHRGGRKNNTKALTMEDTQRVVDFIKNFAEDRGVSLPGRVPGFRRDDILLLPSSTPKSEIYRAYETTCQGTGVRQVQLSTFRKLWNTLLPFVVVAKSMTDLCWICQNNNYRIFRSANLDDQEKHELLIAQQLHLSRVEEERTLYRTMTTDCKNVVAALQIQSLSQNPACSRAITAHYSFDFAQQVHLPNSPYQPGPLYFLTPRKVGIFGVCCEGLPQQVNYLIDEGAATGKGSNAVISYLHHFFENFGLGEEHLQLHCDNCSGQNKNRYVLWYFAWRVMTGRHISVTVNFMPPGHTKFAPDWCFGLLKRKFRRSEVHCLRELVEVVEKSTPVKGVNKAQVVATEDGRVQVKSYKWQEFFGNQLKMMVGIKKLGHFHFKRNSPGEMFYRETLADAESNFTLTNNVQEVLDNIGGNHMPEEQTPPGLPRCRQEYLYKNIRQFVNDDAKDVLTPAPRPQ